MLVEFITALRQTEQRIMTAWLKGLLLVGLVALFAAVALVWLSVAAFFHLGTWFTLVESALVLAGVSILLCLASLLIQKLRRRRRNSSEDPLLATLAVLLEPGRSTEGRSAGTSRTGDAVILAMVIDTVLKARGTVRK